MIHVWNLLATSPTLAQIVPESRGYVLAAEDIGSESKWYIMLAGGILVVSLLFLLLFLRLRRRKHYKAR